MTEHNGYAYQPAVRNRCPVFRFIRGMLLVLSYRTLPPLGQPLPTGLPFCLIESKGH
jgi:hypothetical protein